MANNLTADIVVIGGGTTGAGIARDAAERGFKVILVERGDLGSGTSGSFHGILHSGSRYVVDDPATAAECYHENQILRRIAPTATRDTGGHFLAMSAAEAAYGDRLVAACRAAGLPIEEINRRELSRREPFVDIKSVKRSFAVPDGFVDGGELLRLNRAAAEQHGATFLTHHRLTGFRRSDATITAVTVRDEQTGKVNIIETRFVINAAGVWSGRVGQLAGVTIKLVLDKGVMFVTDKLYSHSVLNRCRPQADGDLLVPDGHRSIMGTTSRIVAEPDGAVVTEEELELLRSEGAQMVPALARAKITYAYAGIRPLHDPGAHGDAAEGGRGINRSFHVLDHSGEGVDNLLSVVGGKVTVYRKMAESTVDALCVKLSDQRPCPTAQVPLLPAAAVY